MRMLGALLLSTGLMPGATLYEQSIARQISEEFADDGVSYMLLSLESGEIITKRWADSDTPVAVGSLVKPILLLAGSQPPVDCTGQGCWLPKGHGRLDAIRALAQSCNAYFLQLAAATPIEAIASAAARVGVKAPPPHSTPETLIGLGSGWRIKPVALMRAYARLSETVTVRSGMRRAALDGTGRGIGRDALAKTGTAPCAHGRYAGDGFTLALYPHVRPRFVVLVRIHGTTGAVTAKTAGRMLALLANGS